jgi:hypothetical protein
VQDAAALHWFVLPWAGIVLFRPAAPKGHPSIEGRLRPMRALARPAGFPWSLGIFVCSLWRTRGGPPVFAASTTTARIGALPGPKDRARGRALASSSPR